MSQAGFRVVINRGLLDQLGTVEVDYHTGPIRRGFSVKSATQGGCC